MFRNVKTSIVSLTAMRLVKNCQPIEKFRINHLIIFWLFFIKKKISGIGLSAKQIPLSNLVDFFNQFIFKLGPPKTEREHSYI